MKPVSEMTHYEILELEQEASRADIERAYRMARATFSGDSMATYSVYGPGDAAGIRERIELAYRVLGDPESRSAYDASLGHAWKPPEAVEIALDLEAETLGEPRPAPEVTPQIDAFDDLGEADEGPFDGARLRRARLRSALELDQVSAVTKVSPSYLRFIEEERFEELPAPVYVRGFVKAYARCIGLDPERVVPSYMQRAAAADSPPRRQRRRRR